MRWGNTKVRWESRRGMWGNNFVAANMPAKSGSMIARSECKKDYKSLFRHVGKCYVLKEFQPGRTEVDVARAP